MMHKTRIFLTIILLIFPYLLKAQALGTVRGTIIDSENGEPVFGATVIERSGNKFAKTDFDGKYSLSLPPGTYEIEFQMFGYAPQKRKVVVTANQTTSVNITFGAQTLETVEVRDRALNDTEASLLALQKKSGTVSDGISAEAIKKSPDSSAGEVVKRVTGITLIGGKYVFVRGLGERYSNTLLNDAVIPSTEPDKRVVPLDIFPASLVKNIRIIKSFAPEDSAEFSGGIVKIETKEYPDDFIMNAGLGVGMNSNTTQKRFLFREGGDFFGRTTSKDELPGIVSSLPTFLPFEPGTRFGGLPPQLVNFAELQFPRQWTPKDGSAPYDKSFNFTVGDTIQTTESGQRLGIIFGTTRSQNFRFRQEKSARYIVGFALPIADQRVSTLGTFQDQDANLFLEEILWGNNLNLAYELANGQQLYWKNLYTVNSEKTVREANGRDRVVNTIEFNSLASEFISRELFNTTFGGNHALNYPGLNRAHKLEWQFNYAEANRDSPNLQQQVWIRGFPTSNVLDPYRRLGNNPDGTRFYSEAGDTVRSGNVKYEIPFEQWDGLKSSFKMGALALDREKSFRFREFGVKSNVGNRGLIDRYPIPGEVTFNPLTFIGTVQGQQLNPFTFSERQAEPNAYDAMQKLHAYFGQVDMPIVSGLRFVGGSRYEDSYQKVRTFVLKEQFNARRPTYGCDFGNVYERIGLIDAGFCNPDNNGIGEIRTRDTLPSANLVWEFVKDQNLRIGYSQTLTRPDFQELSPFAFAAYFGADRFQGNPDLNRTYIHNYDLRYEYYLTSSEYMGVGVFKKQISDPIELVGRPIAGSINQLFTYANAKSADLQGVEFDFRKEFWNLFRFETNFYFIRSNVNVLSWEQATFAQAGILSNLDPAAAYSPTNIKRPLQGQSEFVANFKIDFFLTKRKNTTLGIFYNFFGDRIYAVGTAGTPDAYERGVGLTDIVFSHNQDDKVDFKFAARNIFDQRFRIYQEEGLTGEKKLFRAYREGVSFSMSASYKFY